MDNFKHIFSFLLLCLITVFGCDKKNILPPLPDGDPLLTLDDNVFTISSSDTIIRIPFQHNSNFSASILNQADWLSIDRTKSFVNDTLVVCVDSNSGFSRSAQIVVTVSGNNSTVCDTLTINQRFFDHYIVPIQDPYFKQFLISNFDLNQDNEITAIEALQVTKIAFHDLPVRFLSGIEFFQNLTNLSCYNTLLTSIDLSHINVIKELRCNSNAINKVDISGCYDLAYFKCSGNNITALDLSNNANLEVLNCSLNPIESLNLSSLSNLQNLICDGTSLTTLSLKNNNSLKVLSCLSCFYLETIYLSVGYSVNISKDSKSKIVWIDENGNEIVIPKQDPILLFADENFEAVLVSNYDYDHNGKISLTEANYIKEISCSNKKIKSIDELSSFPNLSILECRNNSIKSLNIRNLKLLERLDCTANDINELDFSNCPNLSYIHCADNLLVNIDISKNAKLEFLAFYENAISSIDLSINKELTKLYCYSNQLKALDVRNNPKLQLLWLANNKISAIDISDNLDLQYLICDLNLLTEVDISKNSHLKYLSCRRNPDFFCIWMSKGQELSTLLKDDTTIIYYK